MALNIRDLEIEELAAALAKLTGETKTEAITRALRERLERTLRSCSKRRLADDLDEIGVHCAALPVRDRSPAPASLSWSSSASPASRASSWAS